ncbi:MAG: hypothetical protein FWE93_02830 [Alphaproteobacteria bacterium]|nr:hypothetical protein [Alphaproteobacteria bacterium]
MKYNGFFSKNRKFKRSLGIALVSAVFVSALGLGDSPAFATNTYTYNGEDVEFPTPKVITIDGLTSEEYEKQQQDIINYNTAKQAEKDRKMGEREANWINLQNKKAAEIDAQNARREEAVKQINDIKMQRILDQVKYDVFESNAISEQNFRDSLMQLLPREYITYEVRHMPTAQLEAMTYALAEQKGIPIPATISDYSNAQADRGRKQQIKDIWQTNYNANNLIPITLTSTSTGGASQGSSNPVSDQYKDMPLGWSISSYGKSNFNTILTDGGGGTSLRSEEGVGTEVLYYAGGGVRAVYQDGKLVCSGSNCSTVNPGKQLNAGYNSYDGYQGPELAPDQYHKAMQKNPQSGYYAPANSNQIAISDEERAYLRSLNVMTNPDGTDTLSWSLVGYLPQEAQDMIRGILARNGYSDADISSFIQNANGPLAFTVRNLDDTPIPMGTPNADNLGGTAANSYAGDGSDTPLTWTEENPFCTAITTCLGGFVRGNKGSGTQTAHCQDYVDEYFCASSNPRVNTGGVNCKCTTKKPESYNCDRDIDDSGITCFWDKDRTRNARVQWMLQCPLNDMEGGASSPNRMLYHSIDQQLGQSACGPTSYDHDSTMLRDKDYCVEFCKKLAQYGCKDEDAHRELCSSVGTGSAVDLGCPPTGTLTQAETDSINAIYGDGYATLYAPPVTSMGTQDGSSGGYDYYNDDGLRYEFSH